MSFIVFLPLSVFNASGAHIFSRASALLNETHFPGMTFALILVIGLVQFVLAARVLWSPT